MQELFGVEAVKNFCLLNAYKYLYRNGLKRGAKTDLAKSKWYFNKYAELGGDISEIEKVQNEFVALLKELTSTDEAVMKSLNSFIGMIEG